MSLPRRQRYVAVPEPKRIEEEEYKAAHPRPRRQQHPLEAAALLHALDAIGKAARQTNAGPEVVSNVAALGESFK